MKNLVEILTEYNLIDNSHIEKIRRLRPDFSESQDVCDILINYIKQRLKEQQKSPAISWA